uniref:Uncharacterized protein n=1 Tax=Periophthalmus magnuspinnatus TaxID=409849 RepID=A0A3B4AIY7_9GOBI
MASLLKDPLFETSGMAPAPNRTYCYLTITKSEVIWRWWKISLRAVDRLAGPGEVKLSHQEMLEDKQLQGEITTVFGQDVLDHAKTLCQGHFNYLEHLSDALLLHILGFLELEDVGQLLRTSRQFWKLCQSEEYWENAVQQRCSTLPDEVVALARDIGWRRIFFTNKIQLQLAKPALGAKLRPVILRLHRFQVKDLIIREARGRRTISLLCADVKVLAKMLAKRMESIMPTVISPEPDRVH